MGVIDNKHIVLIIVISIFLLSIVFLYYTDFKRTGFATFDILAIPTHSVPILNSSDSLNITYNNITVYNQSTSDSDGNNVKNIINWYLNGSSLIIANFPFEGGSLNGSQGDDRVNAAKDYSGVKNNGTAQNILWNQSGGFDGKGAYEFNGTLSNTRLSMSNNGAYNTSEFSALAWIKREYKGTNNNVFLSMGTLNLAEAGCGSSFGGWSIFADDTGTLGVWFCNSSANNNNWTVQDPETTTNVIARGIWYHVGLVFGQNNVSIYINGKLNKTIVSQGIKYQDGGTTFTIGCQGNGGNCFNGTIDDVTIWNRSLSSEQIGAIYNNGTNLIVAQELRRADKWSACITPNDGSGEAAELCSNNLTINSLPTHSKPVINTTSISNVTGSNITVYNQSTSDPNGNNVKNIISWYLNGTPLLLIHMPFEGISLDGNITGKLSATKDYSGRGNNGTAINITWNYSGGFDGRGVYEFNPSLKNDTFISIPFTSNNNYEISIVFWLRHYDSDINEKGIIWRGNKSIDGDREFGLSLSDNTNNLNLWWSSPSASSNITYNHQINNNQWYFVAATLTNSSALLYINGSLVKSTSFSTGRIITNNEPIIIGKAGKNASLNSYFKGNIDELKIYNRSLSATQIGALYQNRTDLLVSQETNAYESWAACITPNDLAEDGSELCSNNLTLSALPTTETEEESHGIVGASGGTTTGSGGGGIGGKTEVITSFEGIGGLPTIIEINNGVLNSVRIIPINDVKVSIATNVKPKPDDVPKASLKDYLYVEIEVGKELDNNIKKASIEFPVSKLWMGEHDVIPEEIKMFRYHSKKWEELDTKLISQDENNFIYSAEVKGFSLFAIGIKPSAYTNNNTEDKINTEIHQTSNLTAVIPEKSIITKFDIIKKYIIKKKLHIIFGSILIIGLFSFIVILIERRIRK